VRGPGGSADRVREAWLLPRHRTGPWHLVPAHGWVRAGSVESPRAASWHTRVFMCSGGHLTSRERDLRHHVDRPGAGRRPGLASAQTAPTRDSRASWPLGVDTAAAQLVALDEHGGHRPVKRHDLASTAGKPFLRCQNSAPNRQFFWGRHRRIREALDISVLIR